MSAECYRVKVPEGRRLTGFTAAGKRVPILPGEHHAHRFPLKVPLAAGTILRFVGAYGRDDDVYIKLPDGADFSQALSVDVQPLDRS